MPHGLHGRSSRGATPGARATARATARGRKGERMYESALYLVPRMCGDPKTILDASSSVQEERSTQVKNSEENCKGSERFQKDFSVFQKSSEGCFNCPKSIWARATPHKSEPPASGIRSFHFCYMIIMICRRLHEIARYSTMQQAAQRLTDPQTVSRLRVRVLDSHLVSQWSIGPHLLGHRAGLCLCLGEVLGRSFRV